MISADALFTMQYPTTASAIGTALRRPGEGADRAAEDLVHQTRGLRRGKNGDGVDEHAAVAMRAL